MVGVMIECVEVLVVVVDATAECLHSQLLYVGLQSSQLCLVQIELLAQYPIPHSQLLYQPILLPHHHILPLTLFIFLPQPPLHLPQLPLHPIPPLLNNQIIPSQPIYLFIQVSDILVIGPDNTLQLLHVKLIICRLLLVLGL